MKLKIKAMEVSARESVPLLFVFCAVAVLGCYAIYLNRIYYSSYGPFYDSMAYMDQLAKIMVIARKDGFVEAMRFSASGSTVFFPWFEGAILGNFVDPTRELAVFIQLPLVLVQAISGYLFFKKVPCYSNAVSAAFSVVLISFLGIYFYNGGLSDLRMDLSQALAFGSAIAFFSVGHKCREPKYWYLFGAMLGISFLVRATTPVYAILVFGICALVDIFTSRGNTKIWFVPYLRSVAIALLLSLWFFILNFKNLYYYYFVWNFDANAALPLSQSIQHLFILFTMHIGEPIYWFLAIVLLSESFIHFLHRKSLNSHVNWIMLLGGAIPVGFLIFFGAALNPFVSLVSVPGVIMFGLAPFISSPPSIKSKIKEILYVIGACAVIGITASHGIENHTKIASPWVSSSEGLQKITHDLNAAIQQSGKKFSTFEVTYSGSLDSGAIMNSFIFDQRFILDDKEQVGKNGVYVSAIQPGLANPVEWKAIKGEQPEDKLQTLVGEALTSADYLIMPENGTSFIPAHSISPYAFQFRNLLLQSGHLTKIAGPIKISSMETVSLYRNSRD